MHWLGIVLVFSLKIGNNSNYVKEGLAMEQSIWQREQAHLTNTSAQIKQAIQLLEQSLQKQKNDIVEERTFVSSEFNDVSGESAISFSQMLQTMALREREYMSASEQLQKAKALYKTPYFGRITIINEDGAPEQLYIGLSTFREPTTQDVAIFDWRAPIASLFYENTTGDAAYTIPNGENVTVEITGRRQYKVRYDQLLQVLDADIYIGDDVLQQLLADTAKTKMKSIVATIQSDQNAVIRSSNKENLLVLGPPGSGKTSVAMQRIAYLLYEYRQTMNARNILLISPSDLFNDYISDVLPELGEDHVQHTTFYRLLQEAGLQRYKAETHYANIERLQRADRDMYKAYVYKTSTAFSKLLQRYVQSLTKANMPFYQLKLDGDVFASSKELSHLFYTKFYGLDMDFRLKKIRTFLQKRLAVKKQADFDVTVAQLRAMNHYVGTDEEITMQAQQQIAQKYGQLAHAIEQLHFVNTAKIYVQALAKAGGTKHEVIAAMTQKALQKRQLHYEDIAPLLFIELRIKKLQQYPTIKHIVIDEIQDYTPLQLAAIELLYPKARFTLLGDRHQLVHPLQKEVLDPTFTEHYKVVELTKSYRSTNEITTYMRAILPHTATESLGVQGEKPTVLYTTDAHYDETIVQLVTKAFVEGESFALLCKNKAACEAFYARFSALLPQLQLITAEQKTYMKGLLVMPAYMAKGFEFSTVVLADADATIYTDKDELLLYTIVSRATRKLYIVSTHTLPVPLACIPEAYYDVEEDV